jgi:hypothetical protein
MDQNISSSQLLHLFIVFMTLNANPSGFPMRWLQGLLIIYMTSNIAKKIRGFFLSETYDRHQGE